MRSLNSGFVAGSLFFIFLGAWRFGPTGTETSWCVSSSDSEVPSALTSLKLYLADPAMSLDRSQDSLPNDSSQVVVVQNDSICRSAARLINIEQGTSDSMFRSIYLFRVNGGSFWAEDTTGYAKRYVVEYVIDSALTKIRAKSLR